jgi:hypothetical protein
MAEYYLFGFERSYTHAGGVCPVARQTSVLKIGYYLEKNSRKGKIKFGKRFRPQRSGFIVQVRIQPAPMLAKK